MGKVRVYVKNQAGVTQLEHEVTVGSNSTVEILHGEDALLPDVTTNSSPVGIEEPNEDDLAVYVRPATQDETAAKEAAAAEAAAAPEPEPGAEQGEETKAEEPAPAEETPAEEEPKAKASKAKK